MNTSIALTGNLKNGIDISIARGIMSELFSNFSFTIQEPLYDEKPNAITLEAMEEAKKIMEDKDHVWYTDAKEMIKDLRS